MPAEDMTPLDQVQRGRAERHANLPAVAARLLARHHARLDAEDLESAASLEYVRLAGSFDPARSHDGEAGFGPYALAYLRRNTLKAALGRGARPLTRPGRPGEPPCVSTSAPAAEGYTLGQSIPARAAACPAEAADCWAWAMRTLAGVRRDAVVMRFREGLKLREIAARLGVTKQAASQMVTGALSALRAAAGH